MEEPIISDELIAATMAAAPNLSRVIDGVIDNAQKIAVEQVRARWIEQGLDNPNNWPSAGHALQAWFDEVHATMRVLLGLV